MAENKKNPTHVLKNWKDMRKEVEGLIKSSSLKEVQGNVKKIVNSAEKDLKSVVEKDLPGLAKKIREERKNIEKMVDKAVQAEVKRALSFVSEHKKDLDNLQEKVESYLKGSAGSESGSEKSSGGAKKKTSKKTTKKKASKKKAKKKTSKKATKKTAKKTTKKATKKKAGGSSKKTTKKSNS